MNLGLRKIERSKTNNTELLIDNRIQNTSLIPLFILIVRSNASTASLSPSPLTGGIITLIKHIRNMT